MNRVERLRWVAMVINRLNVIGGGGIVVAMLRENGVPWAYITGGLLGALSTYLVPSRRKK